MFDDTTTTAPYSPSARENASVVPVKKEGNTGGTMTFQNVMPVVAEEALSFHNVEPVR